MICPPSTCEGLCIEHELNPCVAHEGGLGGKEKAWNMLALKLQSSGCCCGYVNDVGRPSALGQGGRRRACRANRLWRTLG